MTTRYYACGNEGCQNAGAPYHDNLEELAPTPGCPLCSQDMERIAPPDLMPKQLDQIPDSSSTDEDN